MSMFQLVHFLHFRFYFSKQIEHVYLYIVVFFDGLCRDIWTCCFSISSRTIALFFPIKFVGLLVLMLSVVSLGVMTGRSVAQVD